MCVGVTRTVLSIAMCEYRPKKSVGRSGVAQTLNSTTCIFNIFFLIYTCTELLSSVKVYHKEEMIMNNLTRPNVYLVYLDNVRLLTEE